MRETFVGCAVAVGVLTAIAIASPRAEAVTVGSPAVLSAAIHETALAQSVTYYRHHPNEHHYSPPRGYYRYVCRAWWKGCGWEPGHYWNYWSNRYYHPYGYYRAYRYRHR